MNLPSETKKEKLLESFLKERKVLVVDSVTSSRTGIAKTLVEMGARTKNLQMATHFESGAQEIEKARPHIVVADYDLGDKCGLELLQTQRERIPDSRDSLFVLFTSNSAQSAVADAAEEDVDTYILKPYTLKSLKESFVKAAISKLRPTDYVIRVNEGKALLAKGQLERAIEMFDEAEKLHEKPALACYYKAQALLMKQLPETAENTYQKGLEKNPIHYRCLLGMFDLLISQKRQTEAYRYLKRITKAYPSNPKRLSTGVRLAIETKNYRDIEKYYELFTNTVQRKDQLVKHVYAGLSICGQHYLREGEVERAMDVFKKAGRTAQSRTSVLRKIVVTLVESGQVEHANEFLKRFPPEQHKSSDYLAAEYIVYDRLQTPPRVVEVGRKIIDEGIHDPLIYRILIRRSIELSYFDYAQNLTFEAVKRWPKNKAQFLEDLKDFTTRSKS